MRQPLPPITALRALEALDRLGSATAAAEELNLTQSAVSRQLKTLEEHLGVEVFLRDRRVLRLTPQARDYAAEVRGALDRLAQAGLALRLDPTGGALNLAILPSFGMRWLVPRLPDFARRHPDVTVNMSTRLHPFDFASETFDAAIHFGRPEAWPGTEHLPLMEELGRPVAAPSLVPQPLAPQAIARLPLLHIQSRPRAWARWFDVQGTPQGPLSGTSFDQFSTLLQAALHGLGVALLPDDLTEADRRAGRLHAASEAEPVPLGQYHLVWPRERPVPPALRAFIDWLGHIEDEMLPR